MQQMQEKPEVPHSEKAPSANPPESVGAGFSELNEKLEAQFGKNVKALQDSLT